MLSFNSRMVRLEPSYSALLQVEHGGFNSRMVRLEPELTLIRQIFRDCFNSRMVRLEQFRKAAEGEPAT